MGGAQLLAEHCPSVLWVNRQGTRWKYWQIITKYKTSCERLTTIHQFVLATGKKPKWKRKRIIQLNKLQCAISP